MYNYYPSQTFTGCLEEKYNIQITIQITIKITIQINIQINIQNTYNNIEICT